MHRPLLLAISISTMALQAQGPLQVGLAEPVLLDLREAGASVLPPKDARDPSQVEATQEAWSQLVAPLLDAPSVRLFLPVDERRLPLLLAASQALKAQNPDQPVYLTFDPKAPSLLDPAAWGALQGGVLLGSDLGTDPGAWEARLAKAQEQLPGRPWYLWLPVDPGAETATLLGDGGRLVVPPDGPAARLAQLVPPGFTDVEGGRGDLTLQNPGTGEARRWRFSEGEWKPNALPKNQPQVTVTAKDTYDVGALLAKMRAAQLRQHADLRNMEAQAATDLHFQSTKTGGTGMDLGFRVRYFAKAGEPDESLQQKILVNGVQAKLHGEVSLPLVEARTSMAIPVALSLTERYRYTDGGPGSKPGQRRIRFEPVDGNPELYAGELVVDETTGLIQEERSHRSNLPGVVKSESRTITYAAIAPGFWHETDIQGFERWVTPGGITMVQRHTAFSDFQINDPGFADARQAARASKDTMFQQTLDGTRYFKRQADGTRKVEEKPKTSGRAVGGVVVMNPTADIPVFPAAGLLYYDFNALNRGIQLTALTALVFNNAQVAIPNAFWGVDFSSSGTVNLLKGTNRPMHDGHLQDKDGVGMRSQYAELGLARDLGAGFRLSTEGQFLYNQYSEATESKYRTPGYVLPESGWDRGLQGSLAWQGHGFQIEGSYGKGQRPSVSYGAPGDLQTVPDEGRYRWWHGHLGYDLNLGMGKWINLAVGHVGGSGFDRFRSLTVGGMGGDVRVGGIRNDAITADRAYYGHVGFVVPTGPNLRLTMRLDHARMRSLDDGKFYHFTGLGTAGDLPGFWWFTFVRLDLGFGLYSNMPGVRSVNGNVSFFRVF